METLKAESKRIINRSTVKRVETTEEYLTRGGSVSTFDKQGKLKQVESKKLLCVVNADRTIIDDIPCIVAHVLVYDRHSGYGSLHYTTDTYIHLAELLKVLIETANKV